MRMPANASEENENGFRLYARRYRRCRIAMLLDLRPAAAGAILAADLVSSGYPHGRGGALMTPTSMHVPVEEDIEIYLP
jgi:hypothetical protein